MPYIAPFKRQAFDRYLLPCPLTSGELNYCITQMCRGFLKQVADPPKYGNYNEIIGVLESCKLEFYRRAVAAYEDEKIIENGDVY
jgi:hypothetical protein